MRKILYITLFSVLAVSAKAQIPINTFFDVSTPNPIDGRFVIATLSDTSTITDLYDGLLTVVQNTDQLWQYDGTKWVQFQTGSSDNIYNTNGTISDNRTVTVGSGNFLNITTQDGDGQIFIQDGIGLQLGGNTSTPGGRETVNFPNVGGGLQYGANYSNRAGFGNRTIPDWGYISEHTVDTLSSLADTTAAANNVGRIVHVVDVDQKWTVNSAGSWEALSGSGGTDDQTAAEVSVTPTGNLNSTDVQAALEEHQSDIDALASGGSDGVATAGVYDGVNEEIDITVNAPGVGFSIDVSALLDNTDAQNLSLSGNTLSLTGDPTTVDLSPYLDDTNLSQAEVEDIAGGLFSGNTETLITATYQTLDNTVDLVVENNLALYDNSSSGFLTSEIDGSVTNEGSLSVSTGGGNSAHINSNTTGSSHVVIEGGSNVTITENTNNETIIITAQDNQTATEVSYDNSTSLLATSTVQGAIDLLENEIDAVSSGASDGVATAGVLDVANQEIDLTVASPGSNFSIPLTLLPTLSGFSGWDQDVSDDFDGNYTSLDFTGTTGLSDGIDNEGTDDQTAAEVTYDNADSGLSATNVKDALDELDSDVTANVITAGNGITKVGSAIELGGNLTKNTTIDGGLVYDFTLDRFDDITFGPASFINIESDSIIMGRTGLPSVINLPTTTYNDLNGGRGFNIRADSAISILTPNKLGGATWLGFTVNEIQEQSTINGFVVIDRKGFIKPGFTTLGSAVNTGSIGYNPGSSTLATWDGSQWNDIGSGGSDGVATAGTLDVANEEIDITVNGNTDFSINMSSIENLISFSQFARYTLSQSLVLNNQTLRNGLTTPGISMTDGGALVLPEATGTYSPSSNGELFYDSNQLQYRANGTTRVVNDWDDLLNIPSHLSDGTVTAAESSYSTISSGLSSTTVQDAIDDIAVTPNETTLGAAATTHSVDLGNKQNHIELVSLTSTDTNDQIDLTVTNPKNGGVYTFHFIGADGEEIGWPSNFYYANETQMPQAGSPMTLTASDFFTCYYSSTNSRFYCK